MTPWIPNDLQKEWLAEKYSYDATTGVIRFKQTARDVKLTPCKGYLLMRVTNKSLDLRRKLYAHRVAWFLHTGSFPPEDVDHIDHDKTNNRIINLRLASSFENARHIRKPSGGSRNKCTSKFKGVHFQASRGYWIASVRKEKQFKYLGHFSTEREAALAYNAAALDLFGEFACLNEV